MADRQPQEAHEAQREADGCLPVLLRVTWMMWGVLCLFGCAALVAYEIAPVLSDVLFLLVAAGLIAVRYIDVTRFHGETADGEPATLADWRRYATGVVLVSLAVWGLARLAAFRDWL